MHFELVRTEEKIIMSYFTSEALT